MTGSSMMLQDSGGLVLTAEAGKGRRDVSAQQWMQEQNELGGWQEKELPGLLQFVLLWFMDGAYCLACPEPHLHKQPS